jgi:hypothetical protein
LLITILGQAIIVQFGGIVFRIDPSGLSASNWAISIALGTGSLIIGFLLRCLPDPKNIPIWMLGGSGVINAEIRNNNTVPEPKVSDPVIVAVLPEIHDELADSTTSLAGRRWNDAIGKTRAQIRVVKVFKLPPNVARPSTRSTKSENPSRKNINPQPAKNSLWYRLRLYILTMGRFRRHRLDGASTLMIDPRRIRQAQTQLAINRNQ